MSSEEESTDLLVFAERSRTPNPSKPTGRQFVYTHVLEYPDFEGCKFTRTTRAPPGHHPQTFGDAMTADHKVLSEENESRLQHRYAAVVEDLYSYWIQRNPTINKIAQEMVKYVCKLSCPQSKSHVLLIHSILWCFIALVRTCVGITTSQPNSDQKPMVLPRTQSAG